MTEVAREGAVRIRHLRASDREAIQRIISDTGFFSEIEEATALELIDESLARGEASGYICRVACELADDNAVLGYVCYGPIPLTVGTYDLYWVAVSPRAQGRGVGRALVNHTESEIAAAAGRLLLIETSSQELYQSTVGFYERMGYAVLARINDFYKIGDDKIVFGKYLGAPNVGTLER